MEVHELDAEVVVEVPVHAGFPLIKNATGDARLIQINVGKASGKFPGAQAVVEAAVFTPDQPERGIGGFDVFAAEPTQTFVVGAVFAGEEVAGLNVSAVEAEG